MDKYVPLDKKSKKEQRKFHAMQRNTWGSLNPVTRTVPNGKGYNRNRMKQDDRRNGREFRNEGTAVFSCGRIGSGQYIIAMGFEEPHARESSECLASVKRMSGE